MRARVSRRESGARVALAQVEPELERLFATLGEPTAAGRVFTQPMRLNLLRRGP